MVAHLCYLTKFALVWFLCKKQFKKDSKDKKIKKDIFD